MGLFQTRRPTFDQSDGAFDKCEVKAMKMMILSRCRSFPLKVLEGAGASNGTWV